MQFYAEILLIISAEKALSRMLGAASLVFVAERASALSRSAPTSTWISGEVKHIHRINTFIIYRLSSGLCTLKLCFVENHMEYNLVQNLKFAAMSRGRNFEAQKTS